MNRPLTVLDVVNGHLADQLGLISRSQALGAGLTRRQIERLLQTEWVVLYPSVYRHRAVSETKDSRLLGALLRAGDDSAISHRAAVAIHGLQGYACDLVEATRLGGVTFRLNGTLFHRTRDLDARDVRHVGPLRVTSPARTLVDLGAVCPPFLVSRCLEEWAARRVVTIDEVRTTLDRLYTPGRPGAPVLRRVLDTRVLADLEPDSIDEGLLAEVLARHGLPLPELHHLVVLDNGLVFELDWSYPEWRVAFELDGYGVHLRSLEAFEHDRDRLNELKIAGWNVLQFTRRAVRNHPRRVVSQVRRLLGSV